MYSSNFTCAQGIIANRGQTVPFDSSKPGQFVVGCDPHRDGVWQCQDTVPTPAETAEISVFSGTTCSGSPTFMQIARLPAACTHATSGSSFPFYKTVSCDETSKTASIVECSDSACRQCGAPVDYGLSANCADNGDGTSSITSSIRCPVAAAPPRQLVQVRYFSPWPGCFAGNYTGDAEYYVQNTALPPRCSSSRARPKFAHIWAQPAAAHSSIRSSLGWPRAWRRARARSQRPSPATPFTTRCRQSQPAKTATARPAPRAQPSTGCLQQMSRLSTWPPRLPVVK